MDDVLVCSINIEQHRIDIVKVLDKLFRGGAKINFSKSNFGLEKVSYLGMKRNSEGIRAYISKVKEMRNKNMPSIKRQIKSYWML